MFPPPPLGFYIRVSTFLLGIFILSSKGFRHFWRSPQPRHSLGPNDEASSLRCPTCSYAHVIHRRPSSRLSKPYSDSRSVPDAERLIKQTYSVHVSLPVDRAKGIVRKWHLSQCQICRKGLVFWSHTVAAYFSPSKLHELDTIDNIRGVGDVIVPDGWFRSARIGRNRRDSRPQGLSPPSPSEMPIPPALPMAADYHRPSSSNNHPYSCHQIPHISPYPSPYRHTSSPHPYLSQSSLSAPAPSGCPSAPSSRENSKSQLVPIEVLVRTAGPRRDPADEQLLRRFNS